MEARVSFRILTKGVEMGCNGLLGGEVYDPPGSKYTFDRQTKGSKGIYFPRSGVHSAAFCIVGDCVKYNQHA